MLGSCYEPEIDKAAAREILDYLMAGGQGNKAEEGKGDGNGGGGNKKKAKVEG